MTKGNFKNEQNKEVGQLFMSSL